MNKARNLDVTHIPYRGGAQGVTDVIGGHIDMFYGGVAVAKPAIDSGSVKALAVTGDTRSSALPDVPTFKEAGVPEFDLASWTVMLAPKGTPAEIVDQVRKATLEGDRRSENQRSPGQAGRQAHQEPGRAGVPPARAGQLRPRGARTQHQHGGTMGSGSGFALRAAARTHRRRRCAKLAGRPIKIICRPEPGAATDVIARLMADSVTRGLGQPVIVETSRARRACRTSDRGTGRGRRLHVPVHQHLGACHQSVTFKSIPYDPARISLRSLRYRLRSANAFGQCRVAGDDRPGMIEYAKANPGKLSYAVDVTAGAAPFAARLLNKRGDLGMVEVPYRSAAQMVQDVASGTVPVLISSMAASNAMVQAGKIRRLAICSTNRFPPLPDLPTINETVPGVTMDGWFVLVAPAGVPADIVARMNNEVGEFLKGDDIRTRLAGFGLATSGAGSPQIDRRIHQPRAGKMAGAGAGAEDRAAVNAGGSETPDRRLARVLPIHRTKT